MSGENAGAEAGAEGQGAGTAQSKWFENDRFDSDARGFIDAKGLAQVEDPAEAISRLIGMGQAADKRFGRPLDSVIDKPADGQGLNEWRRQNAGVFGLPEKAEGYDVSRPKDLPDSIVWDKDMESQFRNVAFERGLSQDDVAALTGLYAGQVKKIMTDADQAVTRANDSMMAELKQQHGDKLDEMIASARQAVQVVGEKAGLDNAGIEAVAAVMSSKIGDAATIKFFSTLGAAMGEDKGLGFGKGGGGGMSPSEAQQKLDDLRKPGGEFYEAKTAAAREKLYPEIERLSKIAAGGNG
jgi:hypothetical protein